MKFNKFYCLFTAPFSTASHCLSLQHLYTFLCFLFPPLPLLVAFLFVPAEPALLPSSSASSASLLSSLLLYPLLPVTCFITTTSTASLLVCGSGAVHWIRMFLPAHLGPVALLVLYTNNCRHNFEGGPICII